MKAITVLAAAGLLALNPATLAAQTYPFQATLRAATVSPDDSSSTVPAAGSGLAVDAGSAFEAALAWRLAPRWGVELSWLRTSLDVRATGPAAAIGSIGDVDADIVALTLAYRPLTVGRCRPYLGLGVHLASLGSFNPASAFASTGLGSIAFDDSVSVTARLGSDFTISERFTINLDIAHHDVATDAALVLPNGSTFHTLRLDVDPWVFALGAGFRF